MYRMDTPKGRFPTCNHNIENSRTAQVFITSKLCVSLLDVTKLHHKLLTRNTLLIPEHIPGEGRGGRERLIVVSCDSHVTYL